MFFLRKVKLDNEPLALKMSGIRIGERLLQIGASDPPLLATMALKIGLSGSTSVVVFDDNAAARARAAAANAGALIDLHITPSDAPLPFAEDAFDVVVVHGTGGTMQKTASSLADTRRVLRHGGRIIVIEDGPKSGLAGVLKPYRPDPQYEASGGAAALLTQAGYKPVRVLSERDGYRFTEGLKT